MTVLITGIAGRVGSTLAHRLVRAGYDVRGTVRPGGRSLHPLLAGRVELLEADLTDAAALERATDGADVIVHLAAQMVIGDTRPDRFHDVNVLGTLRLLEAAAGSSRPVRRFVFASTDNTYGPAAPQFLPITEDHPQLPGDYYGTAKVLAEQLVRNHHELYGLEYTIMRLGSVVAPHEVLPLFRLSWVTAFLGAQAQAGRRGNLYQLFADQPDLSAMVRDAVGDRPDDPAVALTGPGGEPWALHLSDVRDVASGLMLGIEHVAAAGQSFNVVGPHTTTFAEAAAVVAKEFDLDTVTVHLPVTLSFEVSTDKARRVLGYRPAWDFAGTLRTALEPAPQDFLPAGGE
ncbi:NAD-dependent epimerase/dehydratase family protein [Jiangella mangrovi]|uniref:UDP-glucose 4-epimerase n=1 Tax=Jiangella mangrovi TaxID=1524084 RepID=A0A7W9GXP4_9ACTN|nr:NAD(P)-dependent oxidoreductase [Jiangella mangrovi]MBB5791663.1 UDP-glucose 4-epimerase [Jiangella mangrovi]